MEGDTAANTCSDSQASSPDSPLSVKVLINLLRAAKIDKTYSDAARFHRCTDCEDAQPRRNAHIVPLPGHSTVLWGLMFWNPVNWAGLPAILRCDRGLHNRGVLAQFREAHGSATGNTRGDRAG